ncbi:spermatogenesis-associated protein 31D1 [Ailuropoda melanoleuca]|uniref:spermatogenesis-associated protein 31D1 n=1 Tax=Ailuropoda melanoleuca TaxID=9646 RepID=UPI0014941964|nr:spermatogenesis-associated protein 31D1 [Ailuropoda melanoleuca]
MWGLPTVVRRSQEDYCPSAPNPPLNRWASQAHVAISILPGQFPLSDELRTKLERHLRKRLIQHRWGMPYRIYEPLLLMMRPRIFSEIPASQHYRGRTWISKSQSKLSASESFYEGDSDILQLEDDDLEKDGDQKDKNDLEKDQRHHPEKGPKDYLLTDPESSSDNDMGYDCEKELRSPSEKNLTVSVETAGQRQLENALKIHQSKKFKEISEGQLPGTVHSSWHSMKQPLLLSEKSHTEVKQKSLSPSVAEDCSLNTFQELPFVESRAQQMLEAHIKMFHKMMTWGLPPRVLESIQLFKSMEATSRSSFSSSINLISEVNSKPGGFNSLRGSSKYLHGDKAGTANSAPILDRPLPATSTVGKEEQRIPWQSPSDNNHELAGDVQKIDGRQTCTPVKHDTVGNRRPPKLPARQAGARHEPKDKSANSSSRGGKQQGKKMKNLEPAAVSTMSREPRSAPIAKVNDKVKTTVPMKRPQQNISIYQDQKPMKEQLIHELKEKLKRKESQAQAQCTALPPAADILIDKASLTHAHDVSTGDKGASQVLHVHPEDTRINREKQQEPWVPRHVLGKCQNNLPPAVMTMSSKAQELGGGDAGLGTSQHRRYSFPTEDVALKNRFSTNHVVLKEKLESKPSQTLSQKGQPPSESFFRKKMKEFEIWINNAVKYKNENFQEKSRPLSVESRGLRNGQTAFAGMTKAQKITPDIGKFLEEKKGCRHPTDSTHSQQLIPSPIKFGKIQQKEVWAQAQPVQGYPFNYRAPSYKETNTKSCHQEVVCAGQGHTGSIRQLRDQNMPQKAVAFKDQLLHQKYPLSMAHREPVPHPNTTCRHQAGQGPRVTLTTAEGTAFRELSQLFRQKTLLQNFQGGKFPTPK